ncbi:uncharacterized protein [Dermacentor albipictus]|uniref:uncharacterized protein isoform X1 n=1 Tax=Dermacentor albipictus TaxID=60249 RepID=UPI0031FDEF38
MRIEGASRIVQKRTYVSPGEIKAVIGAAAPLYLTPLLAFGGVISHCMYVLLLMVMLTILETLPLTVISLVPSVAAAFIGLADESIPEEIDQQMDNVSMVGLLLLYVAVDLTPLWTRLSLWVLSWRGAPVKPLFAGLMAVAFAASLFLPGAFVTLVLAAFINRIMHNIEDHVVECQHVRSQRQASRQYSLGARMPGVGPSQPRNMSLSQPEIRRSIFKKLRPKHRENSATSLLEHSLIAPLTILPGMASAPPPTAVTIRDAGSTASPRSGAPTGSGPTSASPTRGASMDGAPTSGAHTSSSTTTSSTATSGGPASSAHPSDAPPSAWLTSVVHTEGASTSAAPTAGAPTSVGAADPEHQQSTPSAPMPSSVQQATPMTSPPTGAPLIVPMNAPSPFSGKSRVTPRPSAVLLSDTSLPTSPLKTVFKPFGSKSRVRGGIVSEIDVHLADIEPGKPSKAISAKSAFTALHKALIVGVVYTSIVASECSYITGRTTRILDDEFRSRDKESPMTTMVFLFFMFPMSAVTVVIFWAYIYRLYLRQIDKQLDQEYNLAIRDIFLKKRKAMGAVTKPEMIAVVIFVAFVLTFALNAIGHFDITYTMMTYVLVVLVIGVPREFGNPFMADMSVTWPLIMAHMPWDMIIMRIGGMELAHFSRMSGVSTWIIDKVLVGNLRMMSPFWCQLVLLATTAVLAELDTSFGFGSRVVPDMLQLADELHQNELYLALPVVMQSSYVLLMPYTRISLIFIHQYTDIEYTELLGLSVFVKVVSSICLIFFSNTLNLSLPARTDLLTVANATAL